MTGFLDLSISMTSHDLEPQKGGLRRCETKTAVALKTGYFTFIHLFSIKTVGDRHRHTAYHNKH